MEKGYTKQVVIMFTFDDENNVIDNSKRVGVSYFDEMGNLSRDIGQPVIGVDYNNMTDEQKVKFNEIISDYIELKDKK